MASLTLSQLNKIGFLSYGEKVLISDKASIYGASRISLGNNVRIDDFCILSAGEGGIEIGNHVHIASYSCLIGKESIRIEDFSGVSSRVSIYSSSDDYSGEYMTNPTVPEQFTNVDHRPVVIGRHCIIGAGSVILPGITMQNGVAVGALSLISKDCNEFTIYSGVPARRVGVRKRNLLNVEREFAKK
jgi:acetyltransferase-like isoleucine patch superfamily enzyme